MVLKVPLVHRALLAQQAVLVRWAPLVLSVPPESSAPPDLPEQQAPQVVLVQLAHRAYKVLQAQLALLVCPVHKVMSA